MEQSPEMDASTKTIATVGQGDVSAVSGAPRVSVVIPHFDDLANLDRCLTQLRAQTLPAESFEIVVADNGSPVGIDHVRAVANKRARVIEARERGAGPARNAGVAAATGDVLAFIDSDCRPDPRWLEEGVAALGQAEVVGGAVIVSVDDPHRPTPVEAYEQVFAFRNETYVRRKGFTVTASMFVRRSVFEDVGDFGNGISEDVEWCARARGRGYRIGYASQAKLVHPARRDWSELVRKWRRLTRETYALNVTSQLGRVAWLARSWLVLLSALSHAPKIALDPALHSVADRLSALGVLFRIRAFRFAEAHRVALSRLPGATS